MIYGYIRISTDKQTVDNQRFEIERFCLKNKIKIGQWIEEAIGRIYGVNRMTVAYFIKNRMTKN